MAKPRVKIKPTHLGTHPTSHSISHVQHGMDVKNSHKSSGHVTTSTLNKMPNTSKVAQKVDKPLAKSTSIQNVKVTKKAGKHISADEKAAVLAHAKERVDQKIKQKELKTKASAAVKSKLSKSSNEETDIKSQKETAKNSRLGAISSKLGSAFNKVVNNDTVKDVVASKVSEVASSNLVNSSDNYEYPDATTAHYTDDYQIHSDDQVGVNNGDSMTLDHSDNHESNIHKHHNFISNHSGLATRSGNMMAIHPVDASHHVMTPRMAHIEGQSNSPHIYNPSLGVGSRENCNSNVGYFTDGDSCISLAVSDRVFSVIEKYDEHATLSELQKYRAMINQKLSPYFNRCGITNVESFLDLLDIIYDERNHKLFSLFRSLK